jgi:hypothetical protein
MPRNPGRDLGNAQHRLQGLERKREKQLKALDDTDAAIAEAQELVASLEGQDVTAGAGAAAGTAEAGDA